jgi:hypothetical protein
MAAGGRKTADEALALGLASGLTIEAAARQAEVSPRTAYRRLEEPAFRRRVGELQAGMVSRALGRLADASVEAVDTLRGLLGADSPSARLGAARSILELGNKLRESVELEQRLAALEEQLLAETGRP